MPDLRDRLLGALSDLAMDDLTDAALVEVLIEQLKEAKATLFAAQAAVIKEGMRADDIQRNAREEIKHLRGNPLALASGQFYFTDDASSAVYVVSVSEGRCINMTRRVGRIDYKLQQISVETFARMAASL